MELQNVIFCIKWCSLYNIFQYKLFLVSSWMPLMWWISPGDLWYTWRWKYAFYWVHPRSLLILFGQWMIVWATVFDQEILFLKFMGWIIRNKIDALSSTISSRLRRERERKSSKCIIRRRKTVISWAFRKNSKYSLTTSKCSMWSNAIFWCKIK